MRSFLLSLRNSKAVIAKARPKGTPTPIPTILAVGFGGEVIAQPEAAVCVGVARTDMLAAAGVNVGVDAEDANGAVSVLMSSSA